MQTVLCDLSFAFPKKYCMAGWIGLASSIFWTSSYKYPKPWPTTPDPGCQRLHYPQWALHDLFCKGSRNQPYPSDITFLIEHCSKLGLKFSLSVTTITDTSKPIVVQDLYECWSLFKGSSDLLTYIWQPWFCTTFCKASATIGTHLWMKAKWVWSKWQVMV